MGYTTLEALKDFGGFEEDTDDVLLNAMIGSATSIIESHTDRVFQIDDETEQDFSRVHGMTSRFSGNTLYFFGELADSGAAITDNPTVVYLPEDGPPYYGIHITEGAWAYPTVTVYGWWGHSKTPPPAIEMACLMLSKWLYDSRDTTSGAVAVVTIGGQVLLPRGLPDNVVTILAPFRKVVVV